MTITESLEATIASDTVLAEDRFAAIVGLCRYFAAQIDEAGDSASSRLTAAYLSALKDLQRALGTETKEPAVGKLASVRGIRDVGKPSKKRAERPA